MEKKKKNLEEICTLKLYSLPNCPAEEGRLTKIKD
jgi:hypothetical protein